MKLLCRECRRIIDYDMTYEEYLKQEKITCENSECKTESKSSSFIPMDVISNLTDKERWSIQHLNDNNDLLIAFSKLKDEDIIEFNLKISPLKKAYEEYLNGQFDELISPSPKCPKCGSKKFTTGQRGYSMLTGFLGSSKTVNRCSRCGHTWKPKK